jgi:hypothetical protein
LARARGIPASRRPDDVRGAGGYDAEGLGMLELPKEKVLKSIPSQLTSSFALTNMI